jgi:membrane associated rhomboid family serine protease
MTQFRPGSFQILPVVIKNLLIINSLVFLAQITIDGLAPRGSDLQPDTGTLTNLFALHHILSPLFKPWQLITHLFMHGSLMHIFSNMFALWMFGSILENLWGPKRFLLFYILCGLGAAILHLGSLWYESMPLLSDLKNLQAHPSPGDFYNFFKIHGNRGINLDAVNSFRQQWEADPGNHEFAGQAVIAATNFTNESLSEPTLGASGAVFGCLAAFGYLFPNNYIYLYFFVPMKAKWFVILYIGLELFLSYRNSAGDNIAHMAHLGGALVGFLLVFFWNRTNRRQFY